MSEDNKAQTDFAPDVQNLEQLSTISRFRLQMLAAQVQMDFKEGRPMKNGKRDKPSVRSNNRILFNALNKILPDAGFSGADLQNDEEKRAVDTVVGVINGIMLELALKESKKRIDEQTAQTTTQNKEG